MMQHVSFLRGEVTLGQLTAPITTTKLLNSPVLANHEVLIKYVEPLPRSTLQITPATIPPVSSASSTPTRRPSPLYSSTTIVQSPSLHLLVEEWDNVSDKLLPSTSQEKLADVEILAPLRGRDVLCVGKNYKEYAACVTCICTVLRLR